MDDFKAQQFTLDGQGDIYLVDGPSLLRAFPIGEAVYRATSHHRQKNNLPPPPSDCATNADCPSTKAHHACGVAGDCEAGARGAPESAGLCRAEACVAVGPWTHVFDTASRPWLLPGVVTYAEETSAKKVLDRVMAKARLADPAKRPTFDAMIAEVERHI